MFSALKMAAPSPEGARYRVVAPLGAGGTANVFLALAERTQGFRKLVVLKRLLDHLADNDEVVAMFRHEAWLAARLKHRNVVEAYEVIEDHGRPILVLEYLRGASLRELVREARAAGAALGLRHHLEILRQACVGLHYCHELKDLDGSDLGLVHRDVSPHNVFVTFDEGVRLLDFGIAKVQGHDGGTQTGLLKGKIRYMAPEQMIGSSCDRRADIYALGVMLWEAVSGRDMWSGLTDPLILQRAVNGEVPPLESPDGACPPALREIVDRCLALEPEARFATASELERALASVLDALPRPSQRMDALLREHFGERDDRISGRPLTGNPIELEVPAQPRVHMFAASANGYVTHREEIDVDVSTAVVLHLVKRERRRSTAEPGSAPRPAGEDACDPSYRVTDSALLEMRGSPAACSRKLLR